MSQTSTETENAGVATASDCHESDDHSHAEGHGGHSHTKGHGGHSHWMMIACCVPMVLVAIVLLAGGAGLASLTPVVLCAAMMGLMMVGMSRIHGGGS